MAHQAPVIVNVYSCGHDPHEPKLRRRWRVGQVREMKTTPKPAKKSKTKAKKATCHHEAKGTADMAFLLGDNQEFDLSIAEKDHAGNDVPVEGVTYSVDNDSVLTLTDNGDGTALVQATGTLGDAVVTATDADDNLSGTLDVTVGVEAAESLNLVPGPVREKTDVTPEPGPDEPPADA
jgi:hypothetical protein